MVVVTIARVQITTDSFLHCTKNDSGFRVFPNVQFVFSGLNLWISW